MKKIIRSTRLYEEHQPVPVIPVPVTPVPVDPWSGTAEECSVVAPPPPAAKVRLLPVNPGDAAYTEAYERECIAWADAGCPDLPPSSPVDGLFSREAGFVQARILNRSEAYTVVQRYRMHDRRSAIASVPLTEGTTWRIFEHADGNHSAANLDFGGHYGLL